MLGPSDVLVIIQFPIKTLIAKQPTLYITNVGWIERFRVDLGSGLELHVLYVYL